MGQGSKGSAGVDQEAPQGCAQKPGFLHAGP